VGAKQSGNEIKNNESGCNKNRKESDEKWSRRKGKESAKIWQFKKKEKQRFCLIYAWKS